MLPRNAKPSSKPRKEKLPEIRTLARHPWEITLRELIEVVRRQYGIEVETTTAAVLSSEFLNKGNRPFPLPVLEMDEVMPLPLLRFLCWLYKLPPVDFGLDPEDED